MRRVRRPTAVGGSVRVGLVLSGGGAKGAFEAGVIEAFAAAGIAPTVVAGTSAGALNAATVAAGVPAEEVVDLWSRLESRHVYRLRRDVHRLIRPFHLLSHPGRLLGLGSHSMSEHLVESIGWHWMLDTAPLRRQIRNLFGGETLRLREDTVLAMSCVEAGSGRLVRFVNRAPSGRPREQYVAVDLTIDHLLASAAIPGLFRPIEIDGRLYWDGGLIANTPLKAALPYDPDVVFVVAAGAIDHDAAAPTTLGGTIALMADHLMRYAVLEDLDHAETVNALVRADPEATYHRVVDLVPISPPRLRSGIGHFLDFDPAVARELIGAGRRTAAETLDRWHATRR